MKINTQFHQNLAEIILATGDFIRNEAKSFTSDKIEYKGKNDLVSYVDKTAEQQLMRGCRKLIPDAGFINEESGTTETHSLYRWIIDPLDGTTNFMHGLDCYSISVALQFKEETILGYVYHIPNHEMYAAEKSSGAVLNNQQICVSSAATLNTCLIATGFPYSEFGWMEKYIQVLKALLPLTQGVRRMGSAAIDLAYTACGRFDGFFEFKLNAWDVAAGALLVEEAGGLVSDFEGKRNFLFGKQILATNGNCHEEMWKIIQANHT